jgi:hypothetical protein
MLIGIILVMGCIWGLTKIVGLEQAILIAQIISGIFN